MQLRSATEVRIYDYSADPAELLRRLRAPIAGLRSFVLPMLTLQRGWLHGSHLTVTIRPHASAPAVDVAAFAAAANTTAAQLDGRPPQVSEYLAKAERIAAWENVPPPFLPLHPQGFVECAPWTPNARWSPELHFARDLISTGFVDPLISAADARVSPAIFAARLLGLIARTHPYGVGLGTLSYRSHAEGISAATQAETDLTAVYHQRFVRDEQLFLCALTDPLPVGDDPLACWIAPLHRAWGIGEALAGTGVLDGSTIDSAGRLDKLPVDTVQVSDFHSTFNNLGLTADTPHWFTAHRLVLNCAYSALLCLGLTPLQRYYICYGLAEATDRMLGDPWRDRLARLGAAAQIIASTTGSGSKSPALPEFAA